MNRFIKRGLFTLIFAAWIATGFSQFYNGTQMYFGKNRVQFNEFVWSFKRFEKYDVFFNEDGRFLADYTADFVERVIPNIEAFFDYNVENRIQFIVYNKLTDFRQSNIGLVTGNEQYNVGGTTVINRNKAFLYFEGDYDEYDEQITGTITRMIVMEMLKGTSLVDNVANSTLNSIPEWYIAGLAAYLSHNWDIETENFVKDGITSGRFEKFNRLTGEDAVYAGHSFWKYIADTYGESVIPSIIYLTSIYKSTNTGFSNVLGFTLKELTYEWVGYYLTLFEGDQELAKVPETGKLLKKTKKKVVYEHLEVSPSGNYITYVTNDMGRYKIWLLDVRTGKKKIIFRHEYKLDQLIDYSYPAIAWHTSARYLAFFTEEKGGIRLYYYNIAEKELTFRNFLYFDKVLDFSFSEEGSSFVFSGTRLGKTDIYVFDMPSATYQQITNDVADDLHPRFIENDQKIIFSSNRVSDTISNETDRKSRKLSHDLFIYNYKTRSDVLMRLNNEEFTDNTQPEEIGSNKFIQLSDRQGVINRYVSRFDSTISFIDTTIHYRYYVQAAPITQYARNILEHDYNMETGTVGEIIYNDGRYHLYYNSLDELATLTESVQPTESQLERMGLMAEKDSLSRIVKEEILIDEIRNNQIIAGGDTIVLGDTLIDINNYIFEVEKINAYNERLEGKQLILTLDTVQEQQPKIQLYRPVFYQNSLVSQIDFNFLNASYQAFTGGASYFNPGFNLLFKIGAFDLFEDIKITGGFRFSPDFDANEYLVSVENLTKRFDKQLIFHRQVFKNTGTEESGYPFYYKTTSNTVYTVLRYPFTQVKSLGATISYRNDRIAYLSTSDAYLNKKSDYRNYLGIKLEYVFDNTRPLGINLYSGTRYKIFAEVHELIDKGLGELIVFGADFRHYTRIHRSLIFANRFAWSSSQGSHRILYYLGGVDNWINLAQGRTPTFIPFTEIPIDGTQNYAFQAIATNMRGFSQNIRNGNNFAVINNEIRFPVFKYFANYPLSRSFFDSFQLVGFFDIGSAWSGPTPWSSKNAYDTQVINQGPITITVDTDRNPIVMGYGAGIHAQLLGYFMRFDWAWGIENREILPKVFYFSMSLDF